MVTRTHGDPHLVQKGPDIIRVYALYIEREYSGFVRPIAINGKSWYGFEGCSCINQKIVLVLADRCHTKPFEVLNGGTKSNDARNVRGACF